MTSPYQTLFRLFIFRAKPQDIDTQQGLLLSLLVIAISLSAVFLNTFLAVSFGWALALSIMSVVIDAIVLFFILAVYQLNYRWPQAFAAIIGAQCISVFIILVISTLAPSIATASPNQDAILVVLLVQLWTFAVLCMILKESLECSWLVSIALNIALAIFSYQITEFFISRLT